MPGPNDPPVPPGPGAPPAPPAPPVVPPADPFAVFPDAESFNKRLERERKKFLKDLGYDDEAQAKADREALQKMRTEEEERRKATMSEVDRAKSEAAEAKKTAEAAQALAEENRVRSHLYMVFAEKGIRNFKYAFWKVMDRLETVPEGQELDERAYLDELLKDPSEQAALGVAPPPAAPPPQPGQPGAPPVQRPASTALPGGGAPPAPPPAGGQPRKTAYDMSSQDWNEYKRKLGVM